MNKAVILGFVGVKQSGKSTAVSILRKNYPQVIELMLAGKLKDVCCSVFGFRRTSAEDGVLKEKELDPPVVLSRETLKKIMEAYKEDFLRLGLNYTYDKHIRPHVGVVLYSLRQILQYVGTEVLKQVDPNIHCNVLAQKIEAGKVYSISDMRFPDEYDFFHTDVYDLKAFYVKNNKAENLASGDMHPSERLILTTASKCVTIDNNGTLEDFERLVKKTLTVVLGE
jgi:hypothetical protein